MTARLALWLGGLVLSSLLLAEVLLDPDGAERGDLLVILLVPALVVLAVEPLLRRWVQSRRTVAGAALVAGLASLAVAVASTQLAADQMVVAEQDRRVFLVVLLLAAGITAILGVRLSRSLADDIRRLGLAAEAVASGRLDVRTGIDRHDEVGRAADAMDRMIQRLEELDTEQRRLDAARHRLLTSIGHDLRTPLAAIRAATESLQDGVAADPEATLAGVARQIRVTEQLLDQLVQYARIESGAVAAHRERLSISELADESIDAIRPIARRRDVQLRLIADGPAMVDADAGDLGRVLRNLLDNAVRHSPDTGVVTVSVHDPDPDDGSGVVTVEIEDQGPGIPDDVRDLGFEPLARGDHARTPDGSAGLGLAIAHALVTAAGGAIELPQATGGLVTIRMPRAAVRADHEEQLA